MFDRKKYMREYYHNNKDSFMKSANKYQQSEKGKKKIREYSKVYFQRPHVKQKKSEYDKKRYDQENKLYRQINKQIRRCIFMFQENKKLNISRITDDKYQILYCINLKEVIEHLQPFPKDAMSYHLDHIIPIVNFDLTKKEEIKKAYSPENLQLLSPTENKKKRSS